MSTIDPVRRPDLDALVRALIEEARRRARRYANWLQRFARWAKAKRLGLWGACPRTRYDPYRAVETRR